MGCWQTHAKKLSLSLPVLLSTLSLALPAYPLTIDGVVVRVHDGDTITIEDRDGQPYKVRLVGIDTPELGQGEWGYRAKDYLSSLIANQEVIVITDDNTSEYDKYHRVLGYVFLYNQNNSPVNVALIREGYAYTYMYEHISRRGEYDEAEVTAKSTGVGIWSDPSLQLPSAYRKQHR